MAIQIVVSLDGDHCFISNTGNQRLRINRSFQKLPEEIKTKCLVLDATDSGVEIPEFGVKRVSQFKETIYIIYDALLHTRFDGKHMPWTECQLRLDEDTIALIRI